MAGWLDGWMAGWLDGWMAGWLVGRAGQSGERGLLKGEKADDLLVHCRCEKQPTRQSPRWRAIGREIASLRPQ
jgi:hypothetical protein